MSTFILHPHAVGDYDLLFAFVLGVFEECARCHDCCVDYQVEQYGEGECAVSLGCKEGGNAVSINSGKYHECACSESNGGENKSLECAHFLFFLHPGDQHGYVHCINCNDGQPAVRFAP